MRLLRICLCTLAVVLRVDPAGADPVAETIAVEPPTVAKTFGAPSVPLNGTTSLAFIIRNPNSGTALTGIGFTDPLPSGLVIATPNGVQSTCGGTLTATAGSNALSLSGVTLIANDTCNFSVKVTAIASGPQHNVTSPVTSNEGGTGDPATASTNVPAPALAITKTHSGNFAQGQIGATYTIGVANVGAGPTGGTVTVADTLPADLTATALAGAGWGCNLGSLTCTRTDALAAGGSYPNITLTVDVSTASPETVTNRATVSGGGDSGVGNHTADDVTTVVSIGNYFTWTACRVADTRSGAAIGSGATAVFAITGGPCAVPIEATSVSLNLTVVQPSATGHITVYPADQPLPPISSLNFTQGVTRANNGIIQLATDGSGMVKVFNSSSGPVHVVIDVYGYFQ